jgi:hypothetical protein
VYSRFGRRFTSPKTLPTPDDDATVPTAYSKLSYMNPSLAALFDRQAVTKEVKLSYKNGGT